jgi:hypothetical protein
MLVAAASAALSLPRDSLKVEVSDSNSKLREVCFFHTVSSSDLLSSLKDNLVHVFVQRSQPLTAVEQSNNLKPTTVLIGLDSCAKPLPRNV